MKGDTLPSVVSSCPDGRASILNLAFLLVCPDFLDDVPVHNREVSVGANLHVADGLIQNEEGRRGSACVWRFCFFDFLRLGRANAATINPDVIIRENAIDRRGVMFHDRRRPIPFQLHKFLFNFNVCGGC